MISCKPGKRERLALWTIGALFVVGLQAACARQPADPLDKGVAGPLLTLQPEMALTLTAWPTAPPVITLPPTATAAPQPLWTAPPEPTAVPPTMTPPPADPAETALVAPAPLGANPPPAQILIPSLELNVPVVKVSWDVEFADGTWQSVWQTADSAAGHHRNSANPGEAGNVIISGHHNTRGEVFRGVSEIGEPGSPFGEGADVILVAEDGQQYTYTVVHWDRFQVEGIPEAERPGQAHYLAPSTKATLTLITCWPYDGNSHRVVVVAELQPGD
jgi:sortase A